jgi:hypothetical protein
LTCEKVVWFGWVSDRESTAFAGRLDSDVRRWRVVRRVVLHVKSVRLDYAIPVHHN